MKNIAFLAAILLSSASLSAQTPVKKTVEEFLKMSDKDTTFCELTGVVCRIRNNERGRLFIDDGTGTVLIYGVEDSERRGIIALDVRKGDTLTVKGRRTVYDGRVIEMKYARYVSHKEGPDHANMQRIDEIDRQPSFRGGGMNKFSQWVTDHLHYPDEARQVGAGGTVKVQFIVGFNGAVVEAEVVQKVHPALDAEALRVVKKSPKWKPGMVDGHSVRVKLVLPIIFVAEN